MRINNRAVHNMNISIISVKQKISLGSLRVGWDALRGVISALVLHNSKRDGHVIDDIPKITPTSFLKVCRQPSEGFSHIIGDLLDLEIGTYSVIGWKLEILKGIFRNIADMCRVSEGATRCII